MLCGVWALLRAVPVSAEDGLSSPAIDPSVFRDGAVQSFEKTFGYWTAKCQEIVPLKRQFCNLLSGIYDVGQKQRGTILLATDDSGRPTLLLSVEVPLNVSIPLQIKARHSVEQGNGKKKSEYGEKVPAMVCDTTCKYMIPAASDLILAFNDAGDADIVVHQVDVSTTRAVGFMRKDNVLNLKVHGQGFAEALGASTAGR